MLISIRRAVGFTLAVSILALVRPLTGQPPAQVLPPPNRAPQLILANSVPPAPATALAFAPDGSALYVAGFDKQVRRYKRVKDEFVADGAFRVPVGPGNAGVINALAVSPDGKWVAAAGRAPIRGEVWAGADDGIEEEVRFDPPEVRGDAGIVYLFDPTNPNGGKAIRGQLSEVRGLAFADPAPADGPVLVTAGIEWNAKGEYFGAIRVFDVESGKERASRADLPNSVVPPTLAAFATGPGNKGLRVVVAWDADDGKRGKLLVWDDPGAPGAKTAWHDDGKFNSTLAVRWGKTGAVEELVTGGYVWGKGGGLTVRAPDGTVKEAFSAAGPLHLPLGLAALTVGGAPSTAVLFRIATPDGLKNELRLIGPGASVALVGMNENLKPVLSASRDGRFLAVGGFTDNRVEVYDVAALAGGKGPALQKLAGAVGGFAKVAFLAGEKLWLGGPTDTTGKGGVILDLNGKVRAAAPRGVNEKLAFDSPDAPEPTLVKPDPITKLPWRVTVQVGGVQKTIALPEGETATAAALLPAKPAWDAALGALVAVASVHERSQTTQLGLYTPEGKLLIRLGGPALPVRSLAFSKSRALLAGAGDDGTIAVWSLKNVAVPQPAIEGMYVTTRGADVIVSSVRDDSPAAKKLAPNDVIESVVDGKGVARAVKEPFDFVQAVRTLKIGAEAQIKAKGKAAVAVKVGTATGFRLPLFELWVDRVAAAGTGKHAWVGWTSSGPYDASGADGEARIGWLTATGDAKRPVTLVGAEQYRKLFYKPDFIRRLLETADYALASALPPPPPPEFRVAFPGAAEQRDGRVVTREKLDATVTLSDPDRVHDTSRAELRWQVSGPDGDSEWIAEPFTGGRSALKLTDRAWKRGTYTVRAKLFDRPSAIGDAPLELAAESVLYVPPAPELTVRIDGKEAKPNALITAAKEDEVEVAAAADAKFDPEGAVVKVTWSGGNSAELKRNAGGQFDPVRIKLAGDTTVLVIATNKGATAAEESSSVEVQVRKPMKVVPPPAVKLQVLAPFDLRTATDQPFVVSSRKVLVTAHVLDTNPITGIEWKLGAGEWKPGTFDAKTNSETREIDLGDLQKDDDKGVKVEVRVTSSTKLSASDSAVIRFDGLPEVSVTLPPTVVTTPELNLSGGLKVTSKRRFAVRVIVASSRTGRVREFDPMPNKELTGWEAGVTLFPGENQLGYVVAYDDGRKEMRRAGLVEVKYVRPPVLLGFTPLEIGTGASGTMTVAVASATQNAPELLVNGAPVGVRALKKPVRLFGVPVWVLTASGAPANRGGDRLQPVPVFARNVEADGSVIRVLVSGREVKELAPPSVLLKYAGGVIGSDRLQPVGRPDFTFDLRVRSDTRLTRVEVRHGTGPTGKLEPVGGVSAENAVRAGSGFELTARPTVRLRPGADNYIQVLATNGGEMISSGFYATFTPEAAWVEIDSIREPNGQPIEVSAGNARSLRVAGGVIEVRGRVQWLDDNDPIAADRHLSVVFIANGVAHLPVSVAKPVPGEGRVRRFVGKVYLNAPDPTQPVEVRAELRSGLRAVPQIDRAAIAVSTAAPITRQRLHVLIVGVEVPEAKQGELIRNVIRSIGGKIPGDDPNFTYGRFERDKFEFARLYPPQLGYTKAGAVNKLLDDVRADIELRTARPGEEWVNDVVLLYYQGADWKDERTGRWLLHTAPTLSGAAGKNPAEYAIRLDDLRPVPGMFVALVNVTGAEMTGDALAVDVPHLRYAWTDPGATVVLLGAIEKAVRDRRTVDEMRASVDEALERAEKRAGKRIGHLPDEVLLRVIGLRK
jgi:WD40 repeat protein